MFVYSDFEREIALPFGLARGFGEAWRAAEDAFRRGRALGFGGGRRKRTARLQKPVCGRGATDMGAEEVMGKFLAAELRLLG